MHGYSALLLLLIAGTAGAQLCRTHTETTMCDNDALCIWKKGSKTCRFRKKMAKLCSVNLTHDECDMNLRILSSWPAVQMHTSSSKIVPAVQMHASSKIVDLVQITQPVETTDPPIALGAACKMGYKGECGTDPTIGCVCTADDPGCLAVTPDPSRDSGFSTPGVCGVVLGSPCTEENEYVQSQGMYVCTDGKVAACDGRFCACSKDADCKSGSCGPFGNDLTYSNQCVTCPDNQSGDATYGCPCDASSPTITEWCGIDDTRTGGFAGTGRQQYCASIPGRIGTRCTPESGTCPVGQMLQKLTPASETACVDIAKAGAFLQDSTGGAALVATAGTCAPVPAAGCGTDQIQVDGQCCTGLTYSLMRKLKVLA